MIDWRAKHAMKNAMDYLNNAIFELQNARELQQEMIRTDESADKTDQKFDQFDAEQIEYLIKTSLHIRAMIKILSVKIDSIRERENAGRERADNI